MKCINCYRDIDYGLKFCPKCGFMQPGDREAYETEHPELANAMPMNEISEEVNPLANVTPTSISREEFVRFISSDPHCNDIIEMVDDGVDTYGLLDSPAIEVWYAKCAELIDDKQGFYPYFLKLLSQHPNKARNLLLSQAAADMNLANWQQNTGNNSTAPQAPEPQIAVNGEIIPPLPPALPSESTKIAKPPLDKGKSAAPVHSTLEKTPLSRLHLHKIRRWNVPSAIRPSHLAHSNAPTANNSLIGAMPHRLVKKRTRVTRAPNEAFCGYCFL